MEGIGLERILVRARGAFGLCRVGDGDVVDLVPAVQVAQHFQGADLTALGGGVHEIGVDPEDLHSGGMGGGHDAIPALFAFAGEEHVAPQLEVQQPPDAVRGVFASGHLQVEEIFELPQDRCRRRAVHRGRA